MSLVAALIMCACLLSATSAATHSFGVPDTIHISQHKQSSFVVQLTPDHVQKWQLSAEVSPSEWVLEARVDNPSLSMHVATQEEDCRVVPGSRDGYQVAWVVPLVHAEEEDEEQASTPRAHLTASLTLTTSTPRTVVRVTFRLIRVLKHNTNLSQRPMSSGVHSFAFYASSRANPMLFSASSHSSDGARVHETIIIHSPFHNRHAPKPSSFGTRATPFSQRRVSVPSGFSGVHMRFRKSEWMLAEVHLPVESTSGTSVDVVFRYQFQRTNSTGVELHLLVFFAVMFMCHGLARVAERNVSPTWELDDEFGARTVLNAPDDATREVLQEIRNAAPEELTEVTRAFNDNPHLLNNTIRDALIMRWMVVATLHPEWNDWDAVMHMVHAGSDSPRRSGTQGLTETEISQLGGEGVFEESIEQQGEAGEDTPSCRVCLCEFEHGDQLRTLSCDHAFHTECIDRWLQTKHTCPLCVRDALPVSVSESGTTLATPAVASRNGWLSNVFRWPAWWRRMRTGEVSSGDVQPLLHVNQLQPHQLSPASTRMVAEYMV